MLFYKTEKGQSLLEFAIVLLVLGVIFYLLIDTLDHDKLHNLLTKF